METTTAAETTGKEKILQKWGVREVVTAALLSALTVILMFIGSSLTALAFNPDVMMLASGGAAVFFGALVFMLMTLRVNRFGVTAVFCAILSLLFCTLGNYAIMIPFYIAGGLLLDLVFLRTDKQRRNPWWITAAWTVFSGLYLLSTMIPFMTDLQGYIDDVVANRGVDQTFVDSFLKYYEDPLWVFVIMIATMVAGFLGALIARTLMKKHFARAGAL